MTIETYLVNSTVELLETTSFEEIEFRELRNVESEKCFRHEACLRYLKPHESMQKESYFVATSKVCYFMHMGFSK